MQYSLLNMIETIREKGRAVDWQNDDAIIVFYESHQLFFKNYNLLKVHDEMIDVIQMKLQYVNSLYAKNRYKKALEIIPHLEDLLINIGSAFEQSEKYKKEVMFLDGALKGNLNQYKESYTIFTKLIKIDPENDLYEKWYISMKVSLLNKKMNYLNFLGLAIVIGDMVSGMVF